MERRRVRLIQPRLQLRLTGWFVGLACLGLLFQFLLLAAVLVDAAGDLPNDGPLFLQNIPRALALVLVVSLLITIPVVGCVGVLITFRVAGPLYRMEQHLREIARGGEPGTCRIRKKDELQELCQVLNLALDDLRRRPARDDRQAAPAADRAA